LAADHLSASTDEANRFVHRVLQIAGDFDKAISGARLRRPGERLRTKHDHVRRTRRRYADMLPEVVNLANRLHHSTKRTGRQLSLREISAQLAEAGFVKKNGKQ
jgi:hypothetical protein